MALDATVGGATSNSFVTLEEANTFFANHWSTAKNDLWQTLNADQRERVLISATQILETLRVLDNEISYGPAAPLVLREAGPYDYTIHRLLADQRLQFPRNVDTDSAGEAYIPEEVKDAQCEQAVYLLAFDDSQLSNQMQGVMEEAIAAGGVRVYTQYSRRGTFVAPLALQLLTPYLRKSTRLKRG